METMLYSINGKLVSLNGKFIRYQPQNIFKGQFKSGQFKASQFKVNEN